MFVIAEGCNTACQKMCNCCWGCSEACARVFSRPFSLCCFGASIVIGIPCIISIIYLIKEWNASTGACNKPIAVHLLICVLCHLLNLAYCFYLYYKFKEQGTDTAMEKATKLAMYDWPTCLFVVLLLFQIVWAIIGFVWMGPNDKPCYKAAPGIVMMDLILYIGFLVFLVVGLFFGFLGLLYRSCEEGSMGCCGLAKILCVVCTCGLGGLVFLLPNTGSNQPGKNGDKKPNLYTEEAPPPMAGTGYAGGAADYGRGNKAGPVEEQSKGGPTGMTGKTDDEEKGKFAQMKFDKKSKNKPSEYK